MGSKEAKVAKEERMGVVGTACAWVRVVRSSKWDREGNEYKRENTLSTTRAVDGERMI